jgi:Domain of unknown function (DUF4276)
MSRPLRIGLLAEGEAELGKSVPYIKPEDGGKAIERSSEGGLHKLIRRELESIGITECEFTQRHPSTREAGLRTLRTGHSILDPKYLTQIVSVWQPEEVDLILIVVDADDIRAERESKLAKALATIQNNHIDADDKLVIDRSTGGLAIQNFETWLLADTDTVSRLLAVDLETPDDLENRADTKATMESTIAQSTYMAGQGGNQRPLLVRWNLANHVDLDVMRSRCPEGYGNFSQTLLKTATIAMKVAEKTEMS